MEVLLSILVILLAAFVVGSVARFAVPGPDPMPVWLTIALGIGGAFVGALVFTGIGLLAAGGEEEAQPAPPPDLTDEELALAGFVGMFFVSVVGATILLVLYRTLIQKRPLTGPEAQRPPLRARGLGRILTRRPHRYVDETANPEQGWVPDQLEKLVLLHEAGEIDDAEYELRKAALVERL